MGLRQDDILAPELRSSSVGFWGDGLIKYTSLTSIRFKLFYIHMTQLLLLGKFEYTGGPIFKVVLEC